MGRNPKGSLQTCLTHTSHILERNTVERLHLRLNNCVTPHLLPLTDTTMFRWCLQAPFSFTLTRTTAYPPVLGPRPLLCSRKKRGDPTQRRVRKRAAGPPDVLLQGYGEARGVRAFWSEVWNVQRAWPASKNTPDIFIICMSLHSRVMALCKYSTEVG